MPDRTVVVFQSGGPAKQLLLYELAYVELYGQDVTIRSMQDPTWVTDGIRTQGGSGPFVLPSAGGLFLDALRDQFSKSGRCFALDSAEGDVIPPSLYAPMPTTARSGNFGHKGRPGKIGGSAHSTGPGDFLSSATDALNEITDGKPATIAKEELRGVLEEAVKQGGAPDLVLLTLEGTPLFAGGLNIPRAKMPQVAHNLWPDLMKDLHDQGIEMKPGTVAPMSLLPTQKEISAARVGGMLEKFEEHRKPLGAILVSQDNRVLDGHHRWALGVMLQTENPKNVKMNVMRIGADHMKALDLLNVYTKKHGIAPEALEAYDDPEFSREFE